MLEKNACSESLMLSGFHYIPPKLEAELRAVDTLPEILYSSESLTQLLLALHCGHVSVLFSHERATFV